MRAIDFYTFQGETKHSMLAINLLLELSQLHTMQILSKHNNHALACTLVYIEILPFSHSETLRFQISTNVQLLRIKQQN